MMGNFCSCECEEKIMDDDSNLGRINQKMLRSERDDMPHIRGPSVEKKLLSSPLQTDGDISGINQSIIVSPR